MQHFFFYRAVICVNGSLSTHVNWTVSHLAHWLAFRQSRTLDGYTLLFLHQCTRHPLVNSTRTLSLRACFKGLLASYRDFLCFKAPSVEDASIFITVQFKARCRSSTFFTNVERHTLSLCFYEAYPSQLSNKLQIEIITSCILLKGSFFLASLYEANPSQSNNKL